MKINKKQIIVLISFAIILIPFFFQFNILNAKLYHYNDFVEERLNTSDNEILINTPGNITYDEPMSGYYHGTYGFENELHYTAGLDLEFLDEYYGHGSGVYCDILSLDGPYNGHNKIVNMRDAQGGTNTWGVHHIDNPQSFGTIEFFLWSNQPTSGSATKRHYIQFRTLDNTIAFQMMIQLHDSTLRYYDGSSWQDIITTTPEVWYHHSINFNCEAGTNGQFSWIVSNEQGSELARIEDKEFENDLDTIEEIYLGTIVSDYSGTTKWDAFGFSWDPNYNIGDNKNEGLLLGYNNNTNLSWQGYSFDGQANNTIYGNYTIPFPSNGHHSIQVFGNDTSGTYYESDLREFTVNYEPPADINIITPENIIYNESMSGYFPGTYGFENDLVGDYPESFSISEPSSTEIQVESEIGGHKNVISLRDWSDSVESWATTTFETPQESGTVEWWFRAAGTSSNRNHDVRIGSGNINGVSGNTNGAINIMFGDGFFYIRNGTDNNVGSYVSNRWYHIRLTFDCSLGGYDGNGQYQATFYIDGENKGTWDFWNIKTSIEKLSIETYGWSCQTNEKTYYDAVGFSWDPNYEIGDNLNESLLLSYNSIPTLDWQGYSLDGQENVTIMGNTTLPMLSNGLHSVQVFGNDSIGNNYQSNLIYFTVCYDNIEPELTNGKVSPRIGDQTTEFNFTVTFWDEDNSLPSYVNVVINGTAYTMEKTFPSDDNYTDGCYYEYTTFLLPSEYNYTYYFECSDGKYTNTTTLFTNLKVNKENYNSPQLLFPEVSPDYGGLTTDFVFNIWYYDLDDNYPLDVNITIDTSTFSMIQVNSTDTNATDGIEFSYTTNLDYGIHNFQFNCSDGLYSNSTNWIIGPEVNPLYGIDPIELLTPSTYSQIYSNLINFSWSSLDAGFGAVNFTLQVSNISDFSHIIFQSEDIAETPIITNLSVSLSITHGDYYWRVRPTYLNYNGSWSSSAKFTYVVNENTPLLILDDIIPANGTSSTIFRFTVIYSDLDNNAPEYVEILINGIPYSMEMVDPLDEDFTDGCIYQYLTLLTPSTTAYTISFKCSDGIFQHSTSTYQGPLVESDSTPSNNQSDNNFNSINIFVITMTLGITIGSIIPFIAFAEIKVRKMKLGEKSSTKIKKKENPK